VTTDPTSAGLLGIHALTALHPGAGTALGTVDLPVQRERHTGWPTIAGSALKGILRDACREQVKTKSYPADELHDGKIVRSRRDLANADDDITALFGPPTASSSEFAGAVSVTDARLLAYPVRSLKGVFAWVTCPAVLERFARDAKLAGFTTSTGPKPVTPLTASVPNDCPCVVNGGDKKRHLLLEEFKLDVVDGDPTLWATSVATLLLPSTPEYADTAKRFAKQLVVVHDDDFTHFVKYATEVTARIGLDYETKTVKGGALFYQEFLPTESLFYAVVIANAARTRRVKGADKADDGATLMGKLKPMIDKVPVLQIGGDETTGKGFCSVRLTTGGK
jgi:CRISPR-associated protein Cmr4